MNSILIMDDDANSRRGIAIIFDNLGYNTLLANSGEEAINLCRQMKADNEIIEIVLLDLVVIDGMGGKDALPYLQEIFPQIKAIAVSGYYDDPVLESPEEFDFAAALQKPFVFSDLIALIDSI